jgi:hypothetical protein
MPRKKAATKKTRHSLYIDEAVAAYYTKQADLTRTPFSELVETDLLRAITQKKKKPGPDSEQREALARISALERTVAQLEKQADALRGELRMVHSSLLRVVGVTESIFRATSAHRLGMTDTPESSQALTQIEDIASGYASHLDTIWPLTARKADDATPEEIPDEIPDDEEYDYDQDVV